MSVVAIQTTGKRGTRVLQPRKRPFETLRDLRTRAGLGAAEVSRLLGYASTSGYIQFEYPRMKDRLIPVTLIEKLIPLFVGRGTPPITTDEMLAISEGRAMRMPSRAAEPEAATGALRSVSTTLRIRYKVEPGVFRDVTTIGSRSEGDSGLAALPEYPPQAQFAVVIADDPRRTMLLCAEMDSVPVLARKGRRCVCMIERGKTGLAEIVVSAFDADGRAPEGTPLGVVVASLTRE